MTQANPARTAPDVSSGEVAVHPLTDNMRHILSEMPDDALITQCELYARLGYAEGVGALLAAMANRGLIEKVPGTKYRTWRKARNETQGDADANL
jgi:hypothetical protein